MRTKFLGPKTPCSLHCRPRIAAPFLVYLWCVAMTLLPSSALKRHALFDDASNSTPASNITFVSDNSPNPSSATNTTTVSDPGPFSNSSSGSSHCGDRAVNPCGPGECASSGSGDYHCSCPNGTFSTQLADGSPTCSVTPVPVDNCIETYTTSEGDTCATLAAATGTTVAQFQSIDPGLNCSFNNSALPAQLQLCLARTQGNNPPARACNLTVEVALGDTCDSLAASNNLTLAELQLLNPGLLCEPPYLLLGTVLCVDSSRLESTPPRGRASCGCQSSSKESWCGMDGRNYRSWCDARCNAALPATSGACSACQAACQGRVGEALTTPAGACPPGFKCPYPSWTPSLRAFAKSELPTAKYPLCAFQKQQCTTLCSQLRVRYSGATAVDKYNTCMRECYGCAVVPCWGPLTLFVVGTTPSCLKAPSDRCTRPFNDEHGRKVSWANWLPFKKWADQYAM